MGIKVGIIGCGTITKVRHAPEYKANPYVDEIIFFDRNLERATALANEFGGRVVQTVEELLTDPTIEVISDCSSNEFHHVFSTKALLSGKHVLCEKPISLTVEHANEIVEAQMKSGKKLMVDHNQRFTRAHQKAKEIIKNEELGKVLTFRTTFGHSGPEQWSVNKSNSTWFFKKDRSSLGVAGDLGIHKVDLLHYLLDDEIEKVSAFQGALDKVNEHGEPIEVCDNIVCSLKTKKGRLGTASFSWTYYGEEDNSTIIYCEKGILKIYHSDQYQLEVIHKNGEKVHYKLESIQTNDNQTNSGVIDAFIDCIRLEQEPIVTGNDALTSLKVILGIMEAAEKGSVIQI
ncbi:Gfo/Idh/MocA family oxidoreductase [Neobacillus sp. 179-C4.2 HS]|uniref:Gfo/Idh/MocA family oxidoreductase n=1 Tax=Neobacillus driksii TaxID=3035913 RepID=A0ABV4YZ99_9BACI|nr:Gfo/Idh/MocA family oxidoreductase [Neobacillus sp. 179.-C4.2 HS]MDP5194764.1 Gfo/Idh/MocA family oxidoreductase [Neobacillus sp. 179.-C4.2 HS]